MFKGLWDRTAPLRKNKVVEKGRHLREDLRERWETADNRVVHKIQVCAATWRCLRECTARFQAWSLLWHPSLCGRHRVHHM